MWVFINKAGFYSAVEDKNDSSRVIVRARCRQHAEALADATGGQVEWSPASDYCARVVMSKATWAAFLAVAALGIQYHNVKATLPGDDDAYHDAMMTTWRSLNDYQIKTEKVGKYMKSFHLTGRKR